MNYPPFILFSIFGRKAGIPMVSFTLRDAIVILVL